MPTNPNSPPGVSSTGLNSPGNTSAPTSAGGGGAQQPPFSQNEINNLKTALDLMSKFAPESEKLANSLREVFKLMKDQQKVSKETFATFKKYSSELVDNIKTLDSTEDKMKRIKDLHSEIIKKMSLNKITTRSNQLKYLQDYHDKLKEIVEDFDKTGRSGTKAFKSLENQLKLINDEIEKTKNNPVRFSTKEAEDTVRTLRIGIKDAINLATKIRFKEAHKDIERAKSSWKAFTTTKGYLARKESHDRMTDERKERAGHIEIEKKRMLTGFQNNDFGEVQGSLGKRLARLAATKPNSVLGRTGLNLLARGEGSVMNGLASGVSGGISGVIGGGMGLEMAAGPIGGIIIEGIKDAVKLALAAVDKNAELNKAAFEKVGQGGFLYGGKSAFDSLSNLRKNLNTFNPMLGIGYEKNLEIAQSLTNSGFGTANLGRQSKNSMFFGGLSNKGMLGGGFGSLQANAYIYGKAAGLDTSSTMTETIKLVTQYQQSLEATSDFFVKINRDAITAGISTSHYVKIIDDINSQYDRSNKLISGTVDVMKLLSQTGRSSAEDIQEAFEAITGGTGKRSKELQTFLYMGMFKNQQDAEGMRRGMAIEQEDAAEAARNALKGAGLNSNFDLKGMTVEQVDVMKANAQRTVKDEIQLKAINASLSRLRDSTIELGNFNKISNDKGLSVEQKAMQFMASRQFLGENFRTQASQALQGYKQAFGMSGINVGAMGANRGGLQGMLTNVKLPFALESLGVNPEMVKRMPEMLLSSAQASLKAVIQGITPGEEINSPEVAAAKKSDINSTLGIIQQSNIGFTGTTSEDLQEWLKKSTDNEDSALKVLLDQTKTLDNIANNSYITRDIGKEQVGMLRAEAEERVRNLVEASTTKDELLAKSFEYLFAEVTNPLNYIAGVVKSLFLQPTISSNYEDLKEMQDEMKSGEPSKAEKQYTDQLIKVQAALEEVSNLPDTDINKAQAMSDLQQKQSDINYNLSQLAKAKGAYEGNGFDTTSIDDAHEFFRVIKQGTYTTGVTMGDAYDRIQKAQEKAVASMPETPVTSPSGQSASTVNGTAVVNNITNNITGAVAQQLTNVDQRPVNKSNETPSTNSSDNIGFVRNMFRGAQ